MGRSSRTNKRRPWQRGLQVQISARRSWARIPQRRYALLRRVGWARVFPTWEQEHHRYRMAKLTPHLLDGMGAVGLAVWYQDDGTLVKDSSSRIACRKLTEDEIDFGLTWFEGLLGPGITYNRNGGFFQIGAAALTGFHELVLPYMHPAVAYKSLYPDLVVEPKLDLESRPFYTPVLAVERYLPSRDGKGVCWNIEVEEPHNFLTQVGVVEAWQPLPTGSRTHQLG